MSQNATVQASEAIMTRIVKLHFSRPEITRESQAAADNLNHLSVLEVSHFLLQAIRAEGQVLECFRERLKVHSATLRGLKQIRIERLILNHAQMMALVDALRLVVPLSEHQLACAQQTLMTMALERQEAVNADAPEVAEFWEVYDYLENLSEEPVLNHSKNPGTIAINLNEFVKLAADHRQKVADAATLRDLLKESRRHKFIEYKAVDSAVRSAHARQNPLTNRPSTVKCWIFKPDRRGNAGTATPKERHHATPPHDYLQLIHDFQTRQQENEVAGLTALKRLLPIAQRDSGQSGVIGRFLLGLYNGQAHRFDLTELRRLDPALFDACLSVLRMDYAPKQEVHEYFENGDAIWQDLSKRWAAAKLAA